MLAWEFDESMEQGECPVNEQNKAASKTLVCRLAADARYVQFCEWAFSELYFYEKISCFAGDFLAF